MPTAPVADRHQRPQPTRNYVTVHVLRTLPLHNLNRDQNGLPKSQTDGGVQRSRISSQSLKRAARVAYQGSATGTSMRTRLLVDEVIAQGCAYATATGQPFDETAARRCVSAIIKSLTSDPAKDAKKADAAAKAGAKGEKADNVIFISRAEIAILARACVEKQARGDALTLTDFIADATSPSLDVAAFGRMFANQHDLGTHAAVAVSHAATTHPMTLTADYFSTVEDAAQGHGGAAHIGMNYFTSGVYYHSFTLDIAQLRRSWSAIDAPGARDDLADLLDALITALPHGKVNSTNAHTLPALVLAETQATRTCYEFDTPIAPGPDGGYTTPSVAALASKRNAALRFDPSNFGPAVLAGNTAYVSDHDFNDTTQVESLDDLVGSIVDAVYGEQDA